MPGAAVGTGWSTCPGCCWAFVQHQRRRRECRQLRRIWPLSGAAQSVTATSMCSSGAPGEGGHPQHGEAGQRSGEGARSGGPGGFPHDVRVGAVTGPLDATYCSPYCVLVRERKKLLLEVGATRQWVSVDRLKPHTAAAAPAVARPPPRGRPCKS